MLVAFWTTGLHRPCLGTGRSLFAHLWWSSHIWIWWLRSISAWIGEFRRFGGKIPPHRLFAARQEDHGHRLWWYPQCGVHIDRSSLYLGMCGWWCFGTNWWREYATVGRCTCAGEFIRDVSLWSMLILICFVCSPWLMRLSFVWLAVIPKLLHLVLLG